MSCNAVRAFGVWACAAWGFGVMCFAGAAEPPPAPAREAVEAALVLKQPVAGKDRPTPTVSVIYGRRRVGKSALIRKALEARPALYFEGLENQSTSEQLSSFCLQLRRQTRESAAEDAPRTWREAFLLLEPVLREVATGFEFPTSSRVSEKPLETAVLRRYEQM